MCKIPVDRMDNVKRLYQHATNRNDLKGELTFDEFRTSVARYFTVAAPDGAAITVLFHVLADGQPTMSYAQLAAALYMWGEGMLEDKLKLLFEMWDQNNDGHLSRREFKNLVKAISKGSVACGAVVLNIAKTELSDDDHRQKTDAELNDELDTFLDTIVNHIDTDSDGKITLREWLEYARDLGPTADIESYVVRNFNVNVQI